MTPLTFSAGNNKKKTNQHSYRYLSFVCDEAASRPKAKEKRRSTERVDPPDGAGELQLHLLQVEHQRVQEPPEAIHPLRPRETRSPSLSLRNRPREGLRP